MSEKKYTREEIFAMLQDPEKFAQFCNQDAIQAESEYSRMTDAQQSRNSYEEYLQKKGSITEATFMDQDGNIYRRPVRPGIKKISRDEYELLEFCHNTDMIPFLREEFERNPINPEDAQRSYESRMINAYNKCGEFASDFRKEW